MPKAKTKTKKEEILAAWKTGRYTIRGIANEFGISVGSAHKMCAHVGHEIEQLVNKRIEIDQQVALLNEHEQHVFLNEYEHRTKNILFFTTLTHKNCIGVDALLTNESTLQDRLIAQTTYEKGRNTVLGKETSVNNTAVQINNTTKTYDRELPPIEAYKKMIHGS